MAREFLHVLRLGTHAEHDYVERGRPLYDALMLNANLVEGSKSALAVLVTRIQKPYFIDPVTYAFALDPRLLAAPGPGAPRPKRSFAALARAYGLDPSIVGARRLTSESFADRSSLEELTTRVIDYQRTVFGTALANDAAFLTSEISDRAEWLGPQFTIAPYFVEDFHDGWRQVNVGSLASAAAASRELRGGAIAIDSRELTPQNIAELAGIYTESDVDTAFLWLTDFDEHSASVNELIGYARLVELLAKQGKGLIASYGGYFSLLLAFRGLKGSSHGVGYGDKRDLEPVVGGGLPPARYYLPAIREFISLGDLGVLAGGMSTAEFRDTVCDCTICSGLLEGGGVANLIAQFTETADRNSVTGRVVAVPTARVYRLSRFHYLSVRALEFAGIRDADSLEKVLADLAARSRWVTRPLGFRATAHISRWIEAMRETEEPI